MIKRKHYPDSKIMDALDACDYAISKAALRLGIASSTLYTWVRNSPNLNKYIANRLELDALKARDKLEEILEKADALDPKFTGNVIQVCKILMDKVEPDRQQLDTNHKLEIDVDLNDKINKLLGK